MFAPQLSEEYGGLGLAFEDLLPVFEQAGRSILATRAMHAATPDEGNTHILELAGTETQKERWLGPRRDLLEVLDDRARTGWGVGPGAGVDHRRTRR